MLVLIVGPSSVGKTVTARRYIEKYGNCKSVNLDDAVAHLNGTETAYQIVVQFGWEKFFQDCQAVITDCKSNDTPDSLTMIDAGEGMVWQEASRDVRPSLVAVTFPMNKLLIKWQKYS